MMLWMVPAIILPMLSNEINGKTPALAMSMVLGALGAVIGFTLFLLTKNKSKVIKYGTYGLMIIGLIGTFIYFENQTESEEWSLITCEICGYKALEDKGKECSVCLAEISKEFMKEEGYETIEELKREEQLYFFGMEEDVTFTEPKIYKDVDLEFRKDDNWLPIVSKTDVDKRREEMDDFGKQIKVDIKEIKK